MFRIKQPGKIRWLSFAHCRFDLIGNAFTDAVYGLQLAAACGNDTFHAAETIQQPESHFY